MVAKLEKEKVVYARLIVTATNWVRVKLNEVENDSS